MSSICNTLYDAKFIKMSEKIESDHIIYNMPTCRAQNRTKESKQIKLEL